MGVAGLVRLPIGLHDAGRDPGKRGLAGAGRGAGLDHAGEVLVHSDGELPLAEQATQILADMGERRVDDGALLGRPPFHRAEMADREIAALVVGEQRLDREIVADADQAAATVIDRMLGQPVALALGAKQMGQRRPSEPRHQSDAVRPKRIGRAEQPTPHALRQRLVEDWFAVGKAGRLMRRPEHVVLSLGDRVRLDCRPHVCHACCSCENAWRVGARRAYSLSPSVLNKGEGQFVDKPRHLPFPMVNAAARPGLNRRLDGLSRAWPDRRQG